jgi:hypothetical protein
LFSAHDELLNEVTKTVWFSQLEFNRLLEASSYLAHGVDINRIDRNSCLSLGQVLEWLITLQEKRVKEKQIDHWNDFTATQLKLMDVMRKMYEKRKKAEQLKRKVEENCSALSRRQKSNKRVSAKSGATLRSVDEILVVIKSFITIKVREVSN